MSDTYIAWNGDEYPLPAPDGWELKHDGRYWPADRGPDTGTGTDGTGEADDGRTRFAQPTDAPPPTAASTPTTPPPVPSPPAMTPPPMASPAATGAELTPPPGTSPQWEAGAPGTKKGGAGKIIAAVLLFVVLAIGACGVIIVRTGSEVLDAFEQFDIDLAAATEAVEIESCGIENGRLVASGTIRNPRLIGSAFDYRINFIEPDGSLARSEQVSIAVIGPGATADWSVDGPAPSIATEFTCEVASMDLTPFSVDN